MARATSSSCATGWPRSAAWHLSVAAIYFADVLLAARPSYAKGMHGRPFEHVPFNLALHNYTQGASDSRLARRPLLVDSWLRPVFHWGDQDNWFVKRWCGACEQTAPGRGPTWD